MLQENSVQLKEAASRAAERLQEQALKDHLLIILVIFMFIFRLVSRLKINNCKNNTGIRIFVSVYKYSSIISSTRLCVSHAQIALQERQLERQLADASLSSSWTRMMGAVEGVPLKRFIKELSKEFERVCAIKQ